MKYTKFQKHVINKLKSGKSLLLVAPTGLGKTLAVTGDIQDSFCKMVYAVPLRSLGKGIQKEISSLNRNGKQIPAVIHHGDIQESKLFGEEVVITTYDQVVCAVPGLPLSLPLKAGHAIAGALLMSRLILDETHLAWSISDKALSILLAILDFRQKLGLQTVVLTATLPKKIVEIISDRLGMESVTVGEGEISTDEGLTLREENRKVTISVLELKNKGKGEDKKLDWQPLDDKLIKTQGKRIYFANTVERLQTSYDRLIASGMSADKITVLHNRMPRSWRAVAEQDVHDRFGKNSTEDDWLLLTNQVAEAGLDISAQLVISDPAPVDTLVQRAGRCGRWFRNAETKGEFVVITAPKTEIEERKKGLSLPYKAELVLAALQAIPKDQLTWKTEQEWVNKAWGGEPKKAMKSVEESLNEITFALNLFDRAAQENRPGEIAGVFREILSIEVAVEEGNSVRIDDLAPRDLNTMLLKGQFPETSSVSIKRGYGLLNNIRKIGGDAVVIRYDEGELKPDYANYILPGDVLIVPSSMAYLHRTKGLCFGDGSGIQGAILSSNWLDRKGRPEEPFKKEGGKRQTLWEHTSGVMERVYQRFTEDGRYRTTLINILKLLEPEKEAIVFADLIAMLSKLAAGFHDLGKADKRWQAKVADIEGKPIAELLGRTSKIGDRIGVPHTPPGYNAIIKASELLIGSLDSAHYLIRSIALSAARHHSSFLNPSLVSHHFDPHPQTNEFIKAVLKAVSTSETTLMQSDEILEAAKKSPAKEDVPLLLPNVDLFPIYALVGRAILMADREDAAGEDLEKWRAES